MNDKIINYFNWLNDRGQTFSRHFALSPIAPAPELTETNEGHDEDSASSLPSQEPVRQEFSHLVIHCDDFSPGEQELITKIISALGWPEAGLKYMTLTEARQGYGLDNFHSAMAIVFDYQVGALVSGSLYKSPTIGETVWSNQVAFVDSAESMLKEPNKKIAVWNTISSLGK